MTHRLLAVDCLLSAVPLVVPGLHDQGDLLGIFVKTAERTVDGLRRYYYAVWERARPCLLRDARQGPLETPLSHRSAYIKALVGWDAGVGVRARRTRASSAPRSRWTCC